MYLLPVVLFVLGICVIIWAVKKDSSPSSENSEILAILKGIASVKMELKEIQSDFRKAESRIMDYEEKIINYEDSLANLNSELKTTKKLLEDRVSPEFITNTILRQEILERPIKAQGIEKYHEVLELSNQGFSITDIASRLALSQDAVILVLKTAQRREVI